MNTIGIIAALPDEAASLSTHYITPQTPTEIEPGLLLCLSGMGYNNALNAAAALIKQGAGALVSWGVAGGLNEELHSGDLLVAERVLSEQGEFTCHRDWQDKVLVEFSSTSFRVFNTSLYSSEQIAATRGEKRKLFRRTGADAVDMESAAIAELAEKMKLDFIALRVIADEAVATLPPAVIRHTDTLGRPKPIRFALSCLFRPSQLASLLLLARAYKTALHTLNDVATDLKRQHFLYNTPA